MKFCNKVVDEADFNIETEGEVERAGEGSPRAFKSTTIDVNASPLGTVPEEEEATLDDVGMAAFLTMLEDKDMESMFGDTREAVKLKERPGEGGCRRGHFGAFGVQARRHFGGKRLVD